MCQLKAGLLIYALIYLCLPVRFKSSSGLREKEMDQQSSTPEHWAAGVKAELWYSGKISPSPDLWKFNMGWAPDVIVIRYFLGLPLSYKNVFIHYETSMK